MTSALSVHPFLKYCSKFSLNFSNGPLPLALAVLWMIPNYSSYLKAIYLLKTPWTTLVLSRQSIQFVLITPLYLWIICAFWAELNSLRYSNPCFKSHMKCPYPSMSSLTILTSLLRFSHFIFLHSPWKSNHTYFREGSEVFLIYSYISVNLSPIRFYDPFLSIRLTKYWSPYNYLVYLKWLFAAIIDWSKLCYILTGGAHFRLGFMLHINVIDPRI